MIRHCPPLALIRAHSQLAKPWPNIDTHAIMDYRKHTIVEMEMVEDEYLIQVSFNSRLLADVNWHLWTIAWATSTVSFTHWQL